MRIPSRTQYAHAILEIFAEAGVKGTFFTLGWIAERHPKVVRAIVEGGHEIGQPRLLSFRVDSQSSEEFRADIRRTKTILEDIGGVAVQAAIAPPPSAWGPHTPWAWPVLEEEGYRYSSSIYPVEARQLRQSRRAALGLSSGWHACADRNPDRHRPHRLQELSGGRRRLFPAVALLDVARRDFAASTGATRSPAVFYLHPWEVDPGQPRAQGVSAKSRFRHYLNLGKTGERLRRLTRDFRWGRMDSIFLDESSERAPTKTRHAAA